MLAPIISLLLFLLVALAAPPFQPAGGIGTNNTPPDYVPMSDYDFQSLNLALNFEYIQLDLFHHGLAVFNDSAFLDAGLSPDDRYLIQFMAEQEIGHSQVISDMIGPAAALPCNYTYPFTTVRGFVDFCQKLTRVGEAGVYGFLEHLDSRAAAELLLQIVTIKARQQMVFRQFEGLFPMPIWFTPAISQALAWSWLAPYITSCPPQNPLIAWQTLPPLNVTNNPIATNLSNSTTPGNNTTPAITHNRTIPLSTPGRQVNLTWQLPGQNITFSSNYTTNTTAGAPQFVVWISQLNTTYTALQDINGTSASTFQPDDFILGNGTAPVFNGTMFVAITDANISVTPFNFSLINPHVVAGPAVYQAG